MFKFYIIGGTVRDEILGLKSKDVDYVAVPSETLLKSFEKTNRGVEEMFQKLIRDIKFEKFDIFLINPEMYTIRAKFPSDHQYAGTVADIVMSRKEIGYTPGTRNPILVPGTLYDDMERRDFTLNALARDKNGKIIDYFDGIKHLNERLLVTPLPCEQTFNDDPLRILRAIRFSITKGFSINPIMDKVMKEYNYEEKMGVVSTERIREELFKCFKADTRKTLIYLDYYSGLRDYIFKDQTLWLKPTMEL